MILPSGRLRIVLAASEAVPWFKTGGLADVVTSLAAALDAGGHDVTIIVPDYVRVRSDAGSRVPNVSETGVRFRIRIDTRSVEGTVRWAVLPNTEVKVLFIVQDDYFDRSHLYMENGEGYSDNCERYCFFSRAVLEICRQMVLRPDIVHCNDWQHPSSRLCCTPGMPVSPDSKTRPPWSRSTTWLFRAVSGTVTA